jgi:hypothetical protein
MISIIPLDFSSSVQPRRSSWTSSGPTVVRVQASSQRGCGGAEEGTVCGAPFLDLVTLAGPSLPFSLEKRPGMVDGGGGFVGDGELGFSLRWRSTALAQCKYFLWRARCHAWIGTERFDDG